MKKKVKSSTINLIEYNPLSETLKITFNNGGVYEYEKVQLKIYNALANADSAGKYFWKHIRDKYKTKKV